MLFMLEASCDNSIVDTQCLFDLMFTVGVRWPVFRLHAQQIYWEAIPSL